LRTVRAGIHLRPDDAGPATVAHVTTRTPLTMRRHPLGRAALTAAALWTLSGPALAAAQSAASPQLVVRVDDIGMNHSVNMALERVAAMRVPVSASVMFACPWYQEAVEILRRNPHVAVGVHLTLNSEWKGYRWGPVLGRSAAPSLVDSVGYFHPSTAAFLAAAYDLGEVERELSAQVERALRTGLRIAYVDYHMGTAVSTPALRQVVERVAEKYNVGISRYFGEGYRTMFDTPIGDKQRSFMAHLTGLAPGSLNLVVVHAAQETPEMAALVDMNNARQNTATGEPLVARHRQAELEMLLSPEFERLRASGAVTLVTYADLLAQRGRASMRRPR
jgi:chitin disaccharide deacetylase